MNALLLLATFLPGGWGQGGCGPVGPVGMPVRMEPYYPQMVAFERNGWSSAPEWGKNWEKFWEDGRLTRCYSGSTGKTYRKVGHEWEEDRCCDACTCKVCRCDKTHPCCPSCPYGREKSAGDKDRSGDRGDKADPFERQVGDTVGGNRGADGILNFGLDRSRMDGGSERFTLSGKDSSKRKVMEALTRKTGGNLTDDSGKLRLTVVGTEAERSRVLADLTGPLAGIREKVLVQFYAPSDWAVNSAGIPSAGHPTITIQAPPDKPGGEAAVLHVQNDYDGPDQLAQAVTKAADAVRKPNPNFDPSKVPDLRQPSLPGLGNLDMNAVVVLGVLGVLIFLGLKGRQP